MEQCLLYAGGKSSNGYGVRWYKGKSQAAHRLAYVEHHGLTLEDIAGKVVRHRCDNPGCVLPAHLELGSAADNSQDMVSRGRQGVKPALTMDQAREIRRLCVAYPRGGKQPKPNGQKDLARRYGVTQSVIRQIVKGITYKEE